jgi:hypothetical protein
MKTIKQIADELGVSKQKVYRFIVRNHITASSEVKRSKLYDESAEKPSFILGAGRSLAPRRAPCFDTQCQNSYGVTFDKSNKTLYNG